ncbi:MAG: 50S ribosomal protein L28 [Planctomycetota bacterium]|nr:MAG: 50S ribosomal protein L28 [Planctomycetota bacterium]
MSQKCEICGKTGVQGRSITTKGRAKYLGGVGTKVTGISRRRFRPNLQRVRITDKNGTPRRVRVCTQCLRSGAVTKRVRQKPFELPADAEAVLAAGAGKGRKRRKK